MNFPYEDEQRRDVLRAVERLRIGEKSRQQQRQVEQGVSVTEGVERRPVAGALFLAVPAEEDRIGRIAFEDRVLHVPGERDRQRGNGERDDEPQGQPPPEDDERAEREHRGSARGEVLHARRRAGEQARQHERLGPRAAPDVAHEVRDGERDREGGGRLHEGRGQLPERERLAEEQRGREQRDTATREPVGGDEHRRCGAEPEQQRRERPLDGVPEQEPVQHEQLDRERLVALPHPRHLLDATLALEQLRDGRVVEERVGGGDRRARHEHVGDDVDGDQGGERELPRRPGPESRTPQATRRPCEDDRASDRGGNEQQQIRDGIEQPEPAAAERDQRERDRAGAEPVEQVEGAVAARSERRQECGAQAEPRQSGRTGERDVREGLNQRRRRSAAAARRRAPPR